EAVGLGVGRHDLGQPAELVLGARQIADAVAIDARQVGQERGPDLRLGRPFGYIERGGGERRQALPVACLGQLLRLGAKAGLVVEHAAAVGGRGGGGWFGGHLDRLRRQLPVRRLFGGRLRRLDGAARSLAAGVALLRRARIGLGEQRV